MAPLRPAAVRLLRGSSAVYAASAFEPRRECGKSRSSAAHGAVAKAEQIEGKQNPRYLVTSLGKEACSAQKLYGQLYCARGEMENRIRQLLEMAEVESVDPTVSCFLRAAKVESVVDSSPDPPVVRSFLYRLPIHLRRQGHDFTVRESMY
jgi:hypothetical protein